MAIAEATVDVTDMPCDDYDENEDYDYTLSDSLYSYWCPCMRIGLGEFDYESDYLIHELDLADNRSGSQDQHRFRKEKARKGWHRRKEIKRNDPFAFWKMYKPCAICARIRGKGSRPRKQQTRTAQRHKLVEDTVTMDNWTNWTPMTISKAYAEFFDDVDTLSDPDWYWYIFGNGYEVEEEFADKWFSEDFDLNPLVDKPYPLSIYYDSKLEYEALLRAWLGCEDDDFWYPFMDHEAQKINEERYQKAYEKLPPGWVGEKYYDLTPVFVRSRGKKRHGEKEVTLSPVVASSPVLDWVLSGYNSDSGTEFEMLSALGESSDSDWEQVSVA